MRQAARALILFGLVAGAIAYAVREIREQRRLEPLIAERDALAAESLRSFRAHEKMQQVIPAYRPASKPAPGQRDA